MSPKAPGCRAYGAQVSPSTAPLEVANARSTGRYSPEGRSDTSKPPADAPSCPTTWVQLNCKKRHLVFCGNHFVPCPLASGTWPQPQFFLKATAPDTGSSWPCPRLRRQEPAKNDTCANTQKGKLGPDRSLYAQNLNRSLPL